MQYSEASPTNDIDPSITQNGEHVLDITNDALKKVGGMGLGQVTSGIDDLLAGPNGSGVIDLSDRELVLARRHESDAMSPVDVGQLEAAIIRQMISAQTNKANFYTTEHIKEDGFVAKPPLLSEIGDDDTRNMPFLWCVRGGGQPEYATMTEADGVSQLTNFLSEFVRGFDEKIAGLRKGQELRIGHVAPSKVRSLREQAESMLESLTFIGWPEYQEAVQGIGAYWRSLLEDNPDLQICVPSAVAELSRYKKWGTRKSDESLFEDVLLSFTDEELEQLGDRVVRRLDDISHNAANVKVVLLDDWVISGDQMRDTYKHIIKKHPKGARVAQVDNVEAHLIVAQRQRIRQGLLLDPYKPSKGSIPIKAYYEAHKAQAKTDRGSGSHISGQHSAVNYDFYEPLMLMEKVAPQIGVKRPRIALARVEPWYRHPDIKPAITFKNGHPERVLKIAQDDNERAKV